MAMRPFVSFVPSAVLQGEGAPPNKGARLFLDRKAGRTLPALGMMELASASLHLALLAIPRLRKLDSWHIVGAHEQNRHSFVHPIGGACAVSVEFCARGALYDFSKLVDGLEVSACI